MRGPAIPGRGVGGWEPLLLSPPAGSSLGRQAPVSGGWQDPAGPATLFQPRCRCTAEVGSSLV